MMANSLGIDTEKLPSRAEALSKEELLKWHHVMKFEITQLVKENYELRQQQLTDTQLQLIAEGQLDVL